MEAEEGGIVSIRKAQPSDIEDIVDIATSAWEPIYAHRRHVLGETLFRVSHPDWRAQKASEVRAACVVSGGSGVCVAEDGGRVVGFAAYHIDGSSGIGEIGNNAVRPDSQGKGISGTMYRYVLEVFRKSGMRFAKVGTGGDKAHAPARRAYQKAGFDIELPSVQYFRAL